MLKSTPTRSCSVAQALVLVALSFSMAIYWQGILDSYPIIPSAVGTDTKNLGHTFAAPYDAIVDSQAQVSTLIEEFPLLDPYYVEDQDRIIFHTSFGDYIFDKNAPSMSFIYRDGTPLIRHSVFYVNSTLAAPVLLRDYSVDRNTLATNRLDYSASLRSTTGDVGRVRVSIIFDRVQRPKITIQVDPSSALTTAGFNVVWILSSYGNFARFQGALAGVDLNATRMNRFALNDTSIDIGPSGTPDTWRVWAKVDWSDAATEAELEFGEAPVLNFVSGRVVKVVFPANIATLDPVIVGQSSMTGSAASFQRRTFFDGAYYWAFYHDGSHTLYEYSSDGRTWSSTPFVLWSYARTAVWFKGASVYALAASSETGVSGYTSATVYLYFKKGTISGNSIGWDSTVTVDTYTYSDGSATSVQAAIRDLNLIVRSDGTITVAYTEARLKKVEEDYECGPAPPMSSPSLGHVGSIHPYRRCFTISYESGRTLQVRTSSSENGEAWSSPTTLLSETTPLTVGAGGSASWNHRYRPVLTTQPSNVVLGVYNDEGAIKYSSSSAWTSVASLDSTAKNVEQFGSAVSDADNIVHLVYVDSDDTIKYTSYSGSSWSSAVTIGSATATSPSIALGSGHDLHVVFLKSGLVYYVRFSSFSGWGSATTPFGTSFAAPNHLTVSANVTNGMLVALWTEGTASPYSVKLGSLPLEGDWSPYAGNSDPWNKEGLIPYGHYFQNLQEYVSPYTGLLTVLQTDLVLPGRGFADTGPLSFTRVFRTPYTFLSGSPYNYESYPYVNLGLGWSLDWPWLGNDYLHLWDGQGYKITWTNNVFENHQGEHFKLLKNANNTYTLYDKSGTIYQFDSNKRLGFMMDRTHNSQVTVTYDGSNRINYVTDTVGRTISFSYDANSRLSSINSGGRVWTYGYNGNGDLISVQDPLGRVTNFEYTSQYSTYLLTKITYPTTAYSTYTYTEGQVGTEAKTYRVSEQTTKLEDGSTLKQTTFAYTIGSGDRVTSSTLTFSDGTTTQGYVKYDFEGVKVTVTSQNAQSQTMRKRVDEYNSQGAFKKQTMFLGASASNYTNYYRFDSWGNAIYERLAIDVNSSRESYYSFANTDTQNRFVNFEGGNVTDFSDSFYSNTIDSNIHDRLLGKAGYQNGGGSNKMESYYSYSYLGNLLEQKDLLETQWLTTGFTYDGYGNALTRTDPKGNQTVYEYSATYQSAYQTKISNTVDGVVIATQFAYNFTTGDRVTLTSPSGNATDYQYDSLGRLTKTIWPSTGGARAERRVVYDDVNNIATVYDENGNYVKYYYDGLARLTKTETYANSTVYSTETYTYTWNSRVKTRTDPTGNVTTYDYDFLGRQVKLTNPDATYKEWVYDDVNVKVTFKDEKYHPTDYTYDWLGRLVSVTEYVSGQGYNTYYAYDRVGNMLQMKDALNQITTYAYDNLNRLTRTDFPDTTYETRSYDKVGNLVSRTTQNSTVLQYSWDQINRLTRISYPDGSTVTFTYDRDSNRLRMVDSASTTDYTYDARNRLLSEARTIDGQAYTLSYQYDAASNLVRLTYPDGYQLNYAYDALSRITTAGNLATLAYRKDNRVSSITYGNGVQTTYSYDTLDRVTHILTRNGTAALLDLNYAYDANGNLLAVNTSEEVYTYDDLNRLTSGNGPWGTLGYTYDTVGNRLSETVNGTGTTYTIGTYNKLSSAGTISFTYDSNGNRVTKSDGGNSWSYLYDYENRLRQVKLNSQLVLRAWYDGDGRRIKTTEGSATSVYHHRSGSWDPVYVKDLSSGVATDIVFAGNLRIGKIESGLSSYYHLDHLGSVRETTNNVATATFTAKYKPYGATYATSGSPERFRYTGKQLDVSTGLQYYGYRYYDSQTGRFISADDAPPSLRNPQSINQYTYVTNKPTVRIDPDGRMMISGVDNLIGTPKPKSTKSSSSGTDVANENWTGLGNDFELFPSDPVQTFHTGPPLWLQVKKSSLLAFGSPSDFAQTTALEGLLLMAKGLGEIVASQIIENEGCGDMYSMNSQEWARCRAALNYGGDLYSQGWSDFWSGWDIFWNELIPPVY